MSQLTKTTFSRGLAVARPTRQTIIAKGVDPLRDVRKKAGSTAREWTERAESTRRELGRKAESAQREWAPSTVGAQRQLKEKAREAARFTKRAAESTGLAAPRGSIFNQGKPPSQADEPEYQVSVGEFLHTGDEYEPTFGEVMRFDGVAPEIVNGRLAMLGFVAAAAAELWTGQSIFQQWSTRPWWIVGAGVLFAAASMYPFLVGKKIQKVGPLAGLLSPTAEIINARTAMAAFATMLAIEWVKGSAFFAHTFGR